MVLPYEKLFELSSDPMAIVKLDGEFISINLAFTNAVGWKIPELKKKIIWDFILPSSLKEPSNFSWNLNHGHPIIFVDSMFRCETGEIRQFRWSAYPDLETGTIAFLIREPGKFDEENSLFQVAAEASPTVILVVSKSEIIYSNRLIEIVFGYSKGEITGKSVEFLIPPSLVSSHLNFRRQYEKAPYLRLMGEKRALSGLRKDGSVFPVDIGLNPVVGLEQQVVVCSIIDLTRRKEAEKIIADRIKDLEERINFLDILSKTDALTSLNNRRSLDMQLELQCNIAQRNAETISFLLLDIDNFKNYNDTNGHLSGDEALKMISQILMTHLRRSEVISRFGGEEFGIILPKIDSNEAILTAERLRRTIEEFKFPIQPITVSIGCSTLPYHFDSFSDVESGKKLIEMADQALYFSKRTGKNSVTHFSELAVNANKKPSNWQRYNTPSDHYAHSGEIVH